MLIIMNWTLFFLVSIASARSSDCPLPDNLVSPRVEHKVEFDAKTRLYDYKYNVTNVSGPLKLSTFGVFLQKKAESWNKIQHRCFERSKNGILVSNWSEPDKIDQFPGFSYWEAYGRCELKSGQKIEDLQLKSYDPPGITHFTARALVENGQEEGQNCAGHFEKEPYSKSIIIGATIGPVPESLNQVDADLEFKSKNHHGKVPVIDPTDLGEIDVFVLDSNNFDLANIDIASLEFGMGKAKVKSHMYLNEQGKECSLQDFKRKHKKRKLKLTFDLKEIGVRCNLDYALFLNGKVNGKNLVGAVQMRPVICKPKHFKDKNVPPDVIYEEG